MTVFLKEVAVMCGQYYVDSPAGSLSLEELIASVRAVSSTSVSPQEEKIIEVLFECKLVPENRIPPEELLAEVRRIQAAHSEQLTLIS